MSADGPLQGAKTPAAGGAARETAGLGGMA